MARTIELTHAERRALIAVIERGSGFFLDGDLIIMERAPLGLVPILRFQPVRELSA